MTGGTEVRRCGDESSDRRRFLVRTVAFASAIGLSGCPGDDEAPQTDTTEGGIGTSPTVGPNTPAGSNTETATPAKSDGSTAGSPRTVSFEAPHGATIEATAYGSGECGVVLVPQVNVDRGGWRMQAETIAGIWLGAVGFPGAPPLPNFNPLSLVGHVVGGVGGGVGGGGGALFRFYGTDSTATSLERGANFRHVCRYLRR